MKTAIYMVVLGAALLMGCGVEYAVTQRSVSTTVPVEYREVAPTDPYDSAFSGDVTAHKVTFLDRTGIALAVLGTVSNAVEARREAIKDAVETGKTGTIYYTYETTPVVPGFDTRFYYTWGSSTGYQVQLGDTVMDLDESDISFSGMGFRMDFVSRPFAGGKWQWGLAWDTRILEYEFESTDEAPLNITGRNVEETLIYLPFEVQISYVPTPRVRLSGSLEYDPLMGIIDVAGLDVHEQYGGAIRADVMLKPWMFLNAELGAKSANSGSSDFSREVNETTMMIEISFQLPLRP
jgi:hypothetical protein